MNPRESRLPSLVAIAIAVLLSPVHASGQGEPTQRHGPGWPQWRGPRQDAISDEPVTLWPPAKLWETNVGYGVSSPIALGGRVLAMGHRDGEDTVWCLEADTGRTLWKYPYPAKSDQTSDVRFPGPRSTPATDGKAVYALSLEGRLHCLDAANGKLLWQRGPGELGRQQASPIRHLLPGDALGPDGDRGRLQHDRGHGEDHGQGTLARPRRGRLERGGAGGRAIGRQVLRPARHGPLPRRRRRAACFGASLTASGASPRPWSSATSFFLAPFHGRNLGGRECAVVQIGPERPTVVWKNDEVQGLCLSAVASGGLLFAPDRDDVSIAGESGQKMNLKCIDFHTGEVKWVQRPIPWPSTIVAGGKLVIQTRDGDVILAEASAAAYKELGRVRAVAGRCWTMPALADGRLYCRNNKGDLVCLQVSGIAGGMTPGGKPPSGATAPPPIASPSSLTPRPSSLGPFPVVEESEQEKQAWPNWPQFRGPGGLGVASCKTAPTVWNGHTGEGSCGKRRCRSRAIARRSCGKTASS